MQVLLIQTPPALPNHLFTGHHEGAEGDAQVAARPQAPDHLLRPLQLLQCFSILPAGGFLLRILHCSLQRRDLRMNVEMRLDLQGGPILLL